MVVVLGDPEQHVHGAHGLTLARMQGNMLLDGAPETLHPPAESKTLQFELLEHIAQTPDPLQAQFIFLTIEPDLAQALPPFFEIIRPWFETVLQGDEVCRMLQDGPAPLHTEVKSLKRLIAQKVRHAGVGTTDALQKNRQFLNRTPIGQCAPVPRIGKVHRSLKLGITTVRVKDRPHG